VWTRFSALVQTGSGAHQASCTMGTGSFPAVKWLGRDADPSPPSSAVVKKEKTYTSTAPMGRTACTEPQFLYNGALYLYLYLYSLYRPYGLYRPSVPVQQCIYLYLCLYPPMRRTACTEPQCLYNGALYLTCLILFSLVQKFIRLL